MDIVKIYIVDETGEYINKLQVEYINCKIIGLYMIHILSKLTDGMMIFCNKLKNTNYNILKIEVLFDNIDYKLIFKNCDLNVINLRSGDNGCELIFSAKNFELIQDYRTENAV